MPEDPYAYVIAVFQALPPPNYVLGPKEPKQAPPSPVYIPYVPKPKYPEYIPPEDESDPDKDLEDDDDEDPKEDPADYPVNHDGEEEEEEPSRDDADEEDEEQDEDDDDEEEEHSASADTIPPPPALRLCLFPPSPLTPLSSLFPQIPSPPLPTSPPILPIPLPTASPPLQLLSSDRRADRPEVTLPPRKRLSIVHCSRCEAGESSAAAAARLIEEDIRYGIRDTWIDPRDVAEEEALTTFEGVNTRGRQTEIFQRVKALVDDSQYHYETSRLVDQEARCSREACAHSIGLSSAVHFELQGYMNHTWVQDQRIDAHDTLIATLTTQLSSLQGHLVTALVLLYTQCDVKMAPKRAAPRRTTRLNPGATSDPNQAPSTTTTTITNAQLQAMIDQGVNAALATCDANRTGDDSHTSGTGVRRTEHVTRECTYQYFMKCHPLYFKGTKGVVELTQWFERMETVFPISNCLAKNLVKFATCTLLAGALTWWNSHFRIVGTDAACVMTWIEVKKKWRTRIGLAERYIGGLPDSIYESVAASKPKTMQEATKMATGLMDKKIRTYAERQAANKRKFENTSRNNQGRQQPPKSQDVARA
nr:hypothetical protein [Tanacetum cinerariifolium]